MIRRDTDEAFFVSVYEKAYEGFEMDNQPRSASYYMLTQETDREMDANAESDFDITDKDLDPIYIQAKAYQDCMNATSENRDKTGNGFFEAQEKY